MIVDDATPFAPPDAQPCATCRHAEAMADRFGFAVAAYFCCRIQGERWLYRQHCNIGRHAPVDVDPHVSLFPGGG